MSLSREDIEVAGWTVGENNSYNLVVQDILWELWYNRNNVWCIQSESDQMVYAKLHSRTDLTTLMGLLDGLDTLVLPNTEESIYHRDKLKTYLENNAIKS